MLKKNLGIVLMALTLAGSAYAVNGTGIVDGTNGANADAYAFGRFNAGGTDLGTWSLDSTVVGTDFTNDAITGGSLGIEYVMLNETLGSADQNVIDFTVNPLAGFAVDNITIEQSPYSNLAGTWNGGNHESSQFVLNWTGGGVATLSDPASQILGIASGSSIASGTVLQFSAVQIENHVDAWEITLPQGVNNVQLDWSSVNPVANSDLTREWVTFDADFSVVPEPSAISLIGMATIGLIGLRRRRR